MAKIKHVFALYEAIYLSILTPMYLFYLCFYPDLSILKYVVKLFLYLPFLFFIDWLIYFFCSFTLLEKNRQETE